MICYIILHYMAEKMTIECVETLKKHINLNRDHIIIVDNHSSNKSGQHLLKRYQSEQWCTVLINERNEGFARGNNIGYIVARELGADFIVIMNNDVIIDDPMFSEKLQKLYAETCFDVYGPDILSMATGEHQNVTRFPLTWEGIEKRTKIFEGIVKKTPYTFYRKKFQKDIHELKHKIKRIIGIDRIEGECKLSQNKTAQGKDYKQPVLHGACLIFSKRYISNEKLAFNPNTFLYIEEEILNAECTIKGYSMIYDPVIQVRHYEDVATDYVFRSAYQKEHMKAVEILRSLEVLKSVMNRDTYNQ